MTCRSWFAAKSAALLAGLFLAPSLSAVEPRPSKSSSVGRETLLEAGLGQLAVTDDSEGRQIRGLASSGARTSGMSFVAGMLYDPVTSSTLRGSNSNSTAASGGSGYGLARRAEVAQISVLVLGMTISQDGVPVFNGSLYGTASGFGTAQP